MVYTFNWMRVQNFVFTSTIRKIANTNFDIIGITRKPKQPRKWEIEDGFRGRITPFIEEYYIVALIGSYKMKCYENV